MRVTLVSCGPSAAAFDPTRNAAPVIAISKQAALVRADVWAVFDWPVLRRITPLGTPRLFTITATLGTLRRHLGAAPFTSSASVAESFRCPVYQWALFTTPAALVYARLA